MEPKQVFVKKDVEKFRLTFNKDRKQTVYESLTTLIDKETTIDTFEIIGKYIFVLISNGTAYFLEDDLNFAKSPSQKNTKL